MWQCTCPIPRVILKIDTSLTLMDTQYYGCCLKYWSEQALRMIRPLVVDPFDDPLIRGQLSQKTVIFKGRIIIFLLKNHQCFYLKTPPHAIVRHATIVSNVLSSSISAINSCSFSLRSVRCGLPAMMLAFESVSNGISSQTVMVFRTVPRVAPVQRGVGLDRAEAPLYVLNVSSLAVTHDLRQYRPPRKHPPLPAESIILNTKFLVLLIQMCRFIYKIHHLLTHRALIPTDGGNCGLSSNTRQR